MEARLSDAAESNLVMLAALGDEKAFAELVRRRQGMVRRLLLRLTGDSALADDLAQEAFVQSWRALAQLRQPGAFGGWLKRIAVTVFLQHARRAKLPLDAMDEDMPAPATDSGTRLDLQRALVRLKPAERLCVTLAHGEGLSHGEIVEATGWPLGTVKSHIARGSARLRDWLT